MASKKLRTVNIKGKEYVPVAERIRAFRELYPNWTIIATPIDHRPGNSMTMMAEVYDDQGALRARGHAHEEASMGMINKQSYVENCETSAWGRALACLGIGVDTEIASADELIEKVDSGDPITKEQIEHIRDLLDICGKTVPEKARKRIENDLEAFTSDNAAKAIEYLNQYKPIAFRD